ncbi:unnamed protein product [Euphydryas editha]|uniref:Uncharacterized protein n=1 Tax=Euphydryas editha TaxID=104508 RepID=A0AAU9TY60_EUPED|nr:unnamed protein product [Euphydryas editha]
MTSTIKPSPRFPTIHGYGSGSGILDIFLRGRIGNDGIHRRTKVANIVQWVCKLKWQWAGHIARRSNVSTSASSDGPSERWTDDLKRNYGSR